MKNSLQYLVLSVIVLVLGGALEELLPKVFGVGFPVLLSAAQCAGARRTAVAGSLFALAAGGVTDALSGLPPMTSAAYFLIVAFALRFVPFPRLAMSVTYPCYQVWLAIWTTGIGGAVFGRILVAVPIGMATVLAVHAVLAHVMRKAAIDDDE